MTFLDFWYDSLQLNMKAFSRHYKFQFSIPPSSASRRSKQKTDRKLGTAIKKLWLKYKNIVILLSINHKLLYYHRPCENFEFSNQFYKLGQKRKLPKKYWFVSFVFVWNKEKEFEENKKCESQENEVANWLWKFFQYFFAKKRTE